MEKHGDFLRDFRGDTIHPSTLELMHELGILDEFLRLPHRQVRTLTGLFGDTIVNAADFGTLPTTCKFVALMPQWDFLNFLATRGRHYAGFHLMMKTEATELIEDGGQIVGLRALTEGGSIDIRANLIIGADGRHSTVRERAGFMVEELGAPMDVLWMAISRLPEEEDPPFLHLDAGRVLVMLDRGDYWQCAFMIPKGSAGELMKEDIGHFRKMILELSPWLGSRIDELRSWNDVKLLTVAVDRLPQWYRPGLLCIGDAAHAMSPIFGVGVNLAVQDAAAAANILAEPLRKGTATVDHLRRVQARREWPTRVIQRIQIVAQNRIIRPMLAGASRSKPPAAAKLLNWLPALRRIPARIIGLGVRPEHIRTPEII
jgi:2-polyprenyl-6-methoxyphenol hydroxylase-like FAD-dependent oxidoreductase